MKTENEEYQRRGTPCPKGVAGDRGDQRGGKSFNELADEIIELFKKENLTTDSAWGVLDVVRKKIHDMAFNKPIT